LVKPFWLVDPDRRKASGSFVNLRVFQQRDSVIPNLMAADYKEMADVIERFVNGTSAPWEWDDYFLGRNHEDPFLRAMQKRALRVWLEFPSATERERISAEGVNALRAMVRELRERRPHH